jgi:hypothetical protein
MEAAGSSETSVTTYQAIWFYNPENHILVGYILSRIKTNNCSRKILCHEVCMLIYV